jgi:large subunit ribosomal protein L54
MDDLVSRASDVPADQKSQLWGPMLRALVAAPLRSPTGTASPLLRAPAAIASRGLAKKAAKGKGAPAASRGGPSRPQEELEKVVLGLNIFKGQDEEVKVKADSEYPDWVFSLHKPRAGLEELTVLYQEDPQALSPQDTKRMVKLWNRRRIKELNEEKAK